MSSEPEAYDRRELVSLLERFGAVAPVPRSVLAAASPSDAVRRGWCRALDRAVRGPWPTDDATRAWLSAELGRLASSDASDAMRALAAEVEAALRLTWIGSVSRVRATAKRRTCDLRVGRLNVEVYCPQEHVQERRVVDALLADGLRRASGAVKVATVISHPTTGSGRAVDEDGSVTRDRANNALNYPANKLRDLMSRNTTEARKVLDTLLDGPIRCTPDGKRYRLDAALAVPEAIGFRSGNVPSGIGNVRGAPALPHRVTWSPLCWAVTRVTRVTRREAAGPPGRSYRPVDAHADHRRPRGPGGDEAVSRPAHR